jgi:hypothetical protein
MIQRSRRRALAVSRFLKPTVSSRVYATAPARASFFRFGLGLRQPAALLPPPRNVLKFDTWPNSRMKPRPLVQALQRPLR